MKDRCQKIVSRFLTVLIIALAFVILVLLFKTVTDSEISIFGIKLYYVATESMHPTIKVDSLIVVREVDPDTLEVGDIISFESRDPGIYGMINTHRIYAETTDADGRLAFVTMGDNNPGPDPYLVYPEDISGKVIIHTMPLRGFSRVLSFATTREGFMICVILPLLLLTAIFFNSFMKEMRRTAIEEARALEDIREQKESLQNLSAAVDTAHMTPEEARAFLEQLFGKRINEITIEDIQVLMKAMGGGKAK